MAWQYGDTMSNGKTRRSCASPRPQVHVRTVPYIQYAARDDVANGGAVLGVVWAVGGGRWEGSLGSLRGVLSPLEISTAL